MDGRYQLTDLADQDIFDISLYIGRSGSIKAAEKFIEAIKQKFALLAQTPSMGRRREELAPSLRSCPEGQYLVFYREVADGVEIVRVLHGSRDIRAVFGDQTD